VVQVGNLDYVINIVAQKRKNKDDMYYCDGVGLCPLDEWIIGEDILESFTYELSDEEEEKIVNDYVKRDREKKAKNRAEGKEVEGDGNRIICNKNFFQFAVADREEHSQGFLYAFAPKHPPTKFLPEKIASKRLKHDEVLSFYHQMVELDECPRGGQFVDWFEGLVECVITKFKEGHENEESDYESDDNDTEEAVKEK